MHLMADESIKPKPETSEDAPTSEIDDSASIKLDGKDNTTSLRIVSDIKDLDLFDEEAIAQYELHRAHQIANDQGGPDSGGIDKLEDEETQTEGEDLSSLTVAQLKERCKAAGLNVSGTKSELIARLSEEEDPEVDLDNDEIEDSDVLKKFRDLLSEAGFHLEKARQNYKVKKDNSNEEVLETQNEGE